VATQSSGQGHETVFPGIVARQLGIDPSSIRYAQGLHGSTLVGGSTIASRSLVSAGHAIHAACEALVGRARVEAARHLEVSEADIGYARGELRVSGTDRSIGLLALGHELAEAGQPHPLDSLVSVEVARSFPNGCHVAELEVDPDTGVTLLIAYVMADDFGVLQDPVIVEGQLHGGVAQGIGQALLEHCRFDGAGQLVTGSLMDYALPRADDLPGFVALDAPASSPRHPLGAKGAGEAGATGAPVAISNALADALSACRTTLPDMPFTPERVWRALQKTG